MSHNASLDEKSPIGGFDLTQFYQVFFEEAGENLASMETLLLAKPS